MIRFTKTDNSLTVVLNINGKNEVYTVTSSHPQWANIIDALKANDETKIANLVSIKNSVETYTENNIVIKDNNVFYKNNQLHGLDVDRLLEFIRDGIPYLPLVRFIERKSNNPSFRAVNEMYKFLEHREMVLTERGTVIGYKGVGNDFYSIHGNKSTIITKGVVDGQGRILNTVGSEIACERSCVCDDYQQGCSSGLHIGSIKYAIGWGPKVMIVEFDPADVVSVPNDCECQKLRVCRYKVIGEYTGELLTQNQAVESSSDYVDRDGAGEDDDESYDDGDINYEDDDEIEDDSNLQVPSSPSVNVDYEDGFAEGSKDGKAHKARQFYATDLDDISPVNNPEEYDYVKGYDNGYRAGRYGTK